MIKDQIKISDDNFSHCDVCLINSCGFPILISDLLAFIKEYTGREGTPSD